LIFLDTPGYSKSDNQQKIDENIARQHLRVADYLIWLVDSQNGTVPQQDIDFLQSLELDQPVLVVMSKADKKLESEVKSIIKVAKADLENAEISYV
ncbi:GTP-binding protein, partial [Vibrio parahaemolyticus]